ncbi:hypothetical protein [Candidatus Methylomirabilis sp.]|uniref:hypothetical protein n=1 Tax=Candidatus Methylomirabilis sp. TaxID=2032687 RepID=UPI002A5B35A1|nr:hypothetical protein [Candidatus Methylomirabilis sp.]
MAPSVLLGAWVAAGLTLCMFSFLYKDNPFFRFGEHLYVGISMGYTIVRIYYDVMVKSLYTPVMQEGKWWFLIAAVLGLLVLTRFIPKISWLSRISFAVIVGFGSGVAIPRIISSNILQQVQGTLKPLLGNTGHSLFGMTQVNALLILVGVITVLVYFFFSIEHKGPIQVAARIGIYFLMINFGAGFGYTVMARMSLLIGRFDDLILFASREYGYATLVLLGMIAFGLFMWERGSTAPSGPDRDSRVNESDVPD